MNISDFINGLFEILGSLAIWYNIFALHKDKQYKGTRIAASFFFTSWGYWNMYYYPHLHQFWSLAGSISIAIANTIYASMMFYYWNKNRNTEDWISIVVANSGVEWKGCNSGLSEDDK